MGSPSAQRRRREALLGGALIVAVLVGAAAVALFRFTAEGKRVALEPVTLCPQDGDPSGYVVILLDVSDPLNAIQHAAVTKKLLGIEASIATHERVRVFAIRSGEAGALPAPSFDRCKPPSGEGASNLVENPRRLRKRWEDGYVLPLERALAEGAEGAGSDLSPLMELIQSAVVTSFPEGADRKPRLLVVVSDLLQHTRAYSHYGDRPPAFERFRKSSLAEKVRTNLAGVTVRLLYLRRDGQERVQGQEHMKFWAEYFSSMGVGAGQLEIDAIEG